jgi:hypothetical protein
MEPLGDGTPEDGICLAVECLQGTGNQIVLHRTVHIQILVEDKFDFGIFLHTALYLSGACMEFYPAAASDGSFIVHSAAGDGGFCYIVLGKKTQVAGLDQLGERCSFQSQLIPGDKVQIPQSDPLKGGGAVSLQKYNQRPIQMCGKILPAAVAAAGQGDKLAGKINPPDTVSCGKLVVDHRLFLSGNRRYGKFLPAKIQRELTPDGFLEICRGIGLNGQNFRKAELTDNFCQRVSVIDTAGGMRDHRTASFLDVFSVL